MAEQTGIIEQYAQHLERKASALVFRCTALGALVGAALGGFPLFQAAGNALVPHHFGYATLLLGAAAGGYLGWSFGERRAVEPRFQAQIALRQLQVEQTLMRQVAARPAPPVPAAAPAPVPAPAPAVAPAPAPVAPLAPPPVPAAVRPAAPVPAPAPAPVAPPAAPPLAPPVVQVAPTPPPVVELPPASAPPPAEEPVPPAALAPPPRLVQPPLSSTGG